MLHHVLATYRYGVSVAALMGGAPVVVPDVGGAALITGEGTGMGIDFTYHADISKQVEIRGTGAYQGSAYGKLTYTSPSVKLCRQSDGVWRYANHNLCPQSQSFDHATWNVTYGLSAIGANNATAPDGVMSAETITCSAGGTFHGIRQTSISAIGGVIAGGTFTYSVFAKLGTINWVQLMLADISFTNYYAVTFNVSTGAPGTVSNATWTGSSSITNAGGGWYRCSITVATTSTAPDNVSFNLAPTDSFSWSAAGTETVFVWGAQLKRTPVNDAGGFTATTGYLATTSSTVYDLPFEWDISGNSLGILVEEQRANKAVQSQDFTTSWMLAQITPSSNTTTAPDGTSTGDTLTCINAAGVFKIDIGTSVTAGAVVTFSVFLKYNNYPYIGLRISDFTANVSYVVFNVQTGVVIGNHTGAPVYQAPVSSSMQDAGNGWYRCTITMDINGAITTAYPGIYFAESATLTVDDSWSANGQAVYVWGAQLEEGSFPTSPIHTVAAPVTRVADNITLGEASFPLSDTVGTMVASSMIPLLTSGARVLLQIDDGDPNERISLILDNATTQSQVLTAGSPTFDVNPTGAVTAGTSFKFAMAWAANNASACLNAGSISTDVASVTVPPVTTMNFGFYQANTLVHNGYLQQVTYLPRRATDLELQTLTNDIGASVLLLGENDGLSFDFTYPTVTKQARIKDNTTPANMYNGTPQAKLTYTSPSVKLTRQSDGVWRYANHNLAVQSQTLDNAAWISPGSVNDIGATANSTTAPDGTSTADTLVPEATSGFHYRYQTSLTTANATYVVSAFFKPAGYSWVELNFANDTSFTKNYAHSFDVTNGVTGTQRATTYTGSPSITLAGNGWYKCSIVVNNVDANATHTIALRVEAADTFGSATSANGSDGAYCWGVQLKRYPVNDAGGFTYATGYLATTTTAVYDLPYEWNAALASQGILIEEQRANEIVRSQEFDHASWTKDAVTVTANTQVAPNGTTTGDTVATTVALSEHRIYQTAAGAGGLFSKVISIFAKAGTANFIGITPTGLANDGAVFNLSTGAVTNLGATISSATMTQEANGWWRCILVGTLYSGGYHLVVVLGTTAAQAVPGTSWTGAGETVHLWQGDIRSSDPLSSITFATSPIHTIGGTVTRAADNISIARTSTPYANSGSNSWIAKTFNVQGANNASIVSVGVSRMFFLLVAPSSMIWYSGGGFPASVTGITWTSLNKLGLAYDEGGTSASQLVNGATLVQTLAATFGSITTIQFGSEGGSGGFMNGYLQQLTQFKRRLTNAELGTKTT